ncbi:hypothetical protein HDU90_000030 [Geranomyces variabilis]|nr:hypothetical protein HDU90_000030 [Geranomyces variabilis]
MSFSYASSTTSTVINENDAPGAAGPQRARGCCQKRRGHLFPAHGTFARPPGPSLYLADLVAGVVSKLRLDGSGGDKKG